MFCFLMSFFLKMNFYWSIVALQCCVSFCYAANWSSYVPACSIVSDSFHGLQPTRLLCPWDFPGRNTGGGCHFLLQNQLYVYIYPPPFWASFPLRSPQSIERSSLWCAVLISHLFHTWYQQRMYVNISLPVPSTPSPLGIRTFVLDISVSTSALQ